MSSTSTEPPAYPPLIAGLLRPGAYPHPAAGLRVIETHISWVILAGKYVYKIKKPVDFGFLDFSTQERRRFCCEEELRLNRRYAAELYLAVVPIVGTADRPRIESFAAEAGKAPSPALEYAVVMRRFDENQTFDRLVSEQRLEPEATDRLAEILARFHAAIERAGPEDGHGLPEQQYQAAAFNFSRIRPLLDDPADRNRLDPLQVWTEAASARLEPRLLGRKRDGFIRECHGDLHLGNIVLIEGHPTLFDGIEFNENLRWIDVLSELAFLVMDLEVNGAQHLAYRLLNRYLTLTGDYAGLALFDYYRLYRAMVRAKIALLTRAQSDDPAKRDALLARYRRYVDYGLDLIQPRPPRLLITHGLSGSGKSRLAARLAERLPAIHLRSDVERKRLAGLAPDARSGSSQAGGIYLAAMTARTYRSLADTAEALLAAGHTAIVDATFLKHAQRDEQRRLAERRGARFLILDCRAPAALLRERIQARAAAGNDPSEADPSVLALQMDQREPLDESERRDVFVVDGEADAAVERVAARLTGHAWEDSFRSDPPRNPAGTPDVR